MRIRNLSLIVFLCLFLGCATPSYNSNAQTLEQAAAQRRQSYVASHPELPPAAKERILSGGLYMGMTKDMVLASWGPSSNVTRSGDEISIREVWGYCSKVEPLSDLQASGLTPDQILAIYRMALANRRCTYLFFDNGILKRFEEK